VTAALEGSKCHAVLGRCRPSDAPAAAFLFVAKWKALGQSATTPGPCVRPPHPWGGEGRDDVNWRSGYW